VQVKEATSPYVPTGQAVHTFDPVELMVPIGHVVQVAEPLTAAKVPAEHGVQTVESILLKVPLGHSRQLL
jgi:hypothetical protein